LSNPKEHVEDGMTDVVGSTALWERHGDAMRERDFPNADLPDLTILGEAAARASTSPEASEMLGDIAMLRKPLSAIRTLASA
jgi:hypothetical protein